MRNKIYSILLLLFTIATLPACSDDLTVAQDLEPDSPGTITIRLSSSNISRSIESDNSENLIDNLIIGLYPAGTDETIPAVKVGKFENLRAYLGGDKSKVVTLQLTDALVQSLFGSGNTCRMFVLANTTPDQRADLPSAPTIREMKNLPVSSPFGENDVQTSFIMSGLGYITHTPSAIYGDPGRASGTVNLQRAAAKIKLNISLPDKIDVKDADDNVIETWEPERPENNGIIRVYINNGVDTAIAYPANEDGSPWKPSDSESYYNTDPKKEISYRLLSDSGTGTFNYTMDVPFYTYPNAWGKNDLYDTSQTTLTLIVRWKKQGQAEWVNYYYQVPVTPGEVTRIDSNHTYNINLEVGMLGSTVPDIPVPVEDVSYQIIQWGKEDIDVQISDYRYLVVNSNNIEVQNESSITIPYYSSHPVEIYGISMEYQRFNFYEGGNGDIVTIEIPKEQIDLSTYVHQVDGKTVTDTICNYKPVKTGTNQTSIVIDHALELWTPVEEDGTEVKLTGNPEGSLESVIGRIYKYVRPENPETAFSSYKIVVKFRHADKHSYNGEVTIVQYPGMYIEAFTNPGNATTGALGANVYINNNNPGDQTVTARFRVSTSWSESGEGNFNPNMYVVSISQLNSSEGYYIGDPRMQHCFNDLDNSQLNIRVASGNHRAPALSEITDDTEDGEIAGNWCQEAPALYDGSSERRLKYYYPTVESDVEEYKMRIAPKFRIASSYGKCPASLTRYYARERIATYQEMGCPAGRWRLPTYGELLFMISLSNSGKIPQLFDRGKEDSDYWTAQGLYHVNDDGTLTYVPYENKTQYGYVRGVYDEWYWEQYPEYTISLIEGTTDYQYTLGDVPRKIPTTN